MNYTTKDNWHYKADEGFYFKKDDVITRDIYLGKFDSIENWTVITEEEKVQFEEEKQKELEELKETPVEE
jgi:hypothetical protein